MLRKIAKNTFFVASSLMLVGLLLVTGRANAEGTNESGFGISPSELAYTKLLKDQYMNRHLQYLEQFTIKMKVQRWK